MVIVPVGNAGVVQVVKVPAAGALGVRACRVGLKEVVGVEDGGEVVVVKEQGGDILMFSLASG